MDRQIVRLSAIAIGTLSVVFVVSAASTAHSFELPHEFHTLPNGIRVILAPDRSVPTVSYYTFINAGSRDETIGGTTGLAHVFEHMMFRGTERYPDFDAAVAPMGAQTNAFTGNDLTGYFVNAKSEFLRQIIDIEADRVRNVSFSREVFRTELGSVKEERRRAIAESPQGFLEMRLYDLAFERHTYKHPVIGWEEDLERNMTYEDAMRFKETFYAPEYVVLSVAGDFNPDSALAWISERYGDWRSSGIKAKRIPVEPEQTTARRETLTWKDAVIATVIMLAHKCPPMDYDSPDFLALRIVDRLLFSTNGRLRQRLVVSEQLAEDIDGGVSGSKDTGLWTITATVKRGEDPAEVERIILEELQRLQEGLVPSDELARAAKGYKASRIYRFDRSSRIASTLGSYCVLSGAPGNVEREMQLLDTITPESIQDFARKYLNGAGRTTVLLNPKERS